MITLLNDVERKMWEATFEAEVARVHHDLARAHADTEVAAYRERIPRTSADNDPEGDALMAAAVAELHVWPPSTKALWSAVRHVKAKAARARLDDTCELCDDTGFVTRGRAAKLFPVPCHEGCRPPGGTETPECLRGRTEDELAALPRLSAADVDAALAAGRDERRREEGPAPPESSAIDKMRVAVKGLAEAMEASTEGANVSTIWVAGQLRGILEERS